MKNSQSQLLKLKAAMSVVMAIIVIFSSAANAGGSHHYSSNYKKSSHSDYDDKSYDHKTSRHGTYRKCNKTPKCDKTLSVPLFVGNHKRVGVVKVELDGNDLKVTYQVKKEWRIKQTHLEVSNYYNEPPVKTDGTPDLDAFPFKTKHFTPVKSATITLNAVQWPLGSELYIAAQATVVENSNGSHKQHMAKSYKRSHKSRHGYDKNNRKSHHENRASSNKDDHNEHHNKHDDDHKDDNRKDGSYDHSHGKHDNMRGKSAWAKGMKFPGQKHASYFTYTLETCDPVEPSTIQFANAIHSMNESGPAVVVTVSRTGNLDRAATVEFTTLDDTAINGLDYDFNNGVLMFAAGQSVAEFTVTAIDDSEIEPLELLTLELSNPVGAILGQQNTATVEIEDNDVAPSVTVEFLQAEFIYRERVPFAQITVVRSGDLSTEVQVDYATADGTAQENLDYLGTSGTLVIPPNVETVTFQVRIINDREIEANETVLLQLFNEIGATLGTQSDAVLLIEDDDLIQS